MLPVIRTAIPGPESLKLARELHQWESRNVTFIDAEGRFPVFWESAQDCLVTDVDGNVFLDLTAAFGVAAVGHTNHRVAAAIADQAGRLIHGMGDVHPTRLKVELARKIVEHTPGDLGGVIFGANGGDAIEAALKTARLYTGKSGVIAFAGGYHGLNYGALAVTSRADFRDPFVGQVPTFATHLPYLSPIEDIETALRAGADTIGAVIVEPIQGRGGIVEPPRDWLANLSCLCSRRGVLLIADEIFTGWGRTGDWFACDHDGVVPDILCIGKAMGGGFPISACVAKPEIMVAWGDSTGEALHTSTFLGSPLGCAAALAAIAELEERNLPQRAKVIGDYFKERLNELSARHPGIIVEVRGRGLMLGLRFAERATALNLVYTLLQCGLIVLPAGAGDILEFVPPLIIEKEQIDFTVSAIDAALTER